MSKQKDVKTIDIREYQQNEGDKNEFDDFLQENSQSASVRVVKGGSGDDVSFYNEDEVMMQGGARKKKQIKSSDGASSDDDASTGVTSSDDDDASSVSSSAHSSESSTSSVDTVTLLASDPLYLVLGQYLSSETGKNIASILEEINESLKVLAHAATVGK